MGTSASFALARKITACLVAALLSLALVPASALAEDGHSGAEGSEGAFGSEVPTSPQPPSDPSTEASGSSVILSEGSEAAGVEGPDTKPLTLASGLVGKPNSFINSDVAFDGEPVIGSFTVDGLTYAVIDESHVELVGVLPDWQQVTNSQEGEDASVAPMLASGSDGYESEAAALTLPESVTYEGATYTLASIAPYAFYLSGVTDVALPASVSDVDDRAFRSSDVASVFVAEGNPTYTSFDGALYSADKTRLLLIPEGRVGAVLLPREAEVADPGKFSHCSLVDAISVEDGAAFASENGLVYSSDLTTLLRVPAGATEIAIREGCTTIAAGALEACAKLATINAPATVTSISPDVFHAIPTVSLPAASLTESAPQLTAMVALSSKDDDLPEVDVGSINVVMSEESDASAWMAAGFSASRGGDAQAPAGNDGNAYFADAQTGSAARASASESWICAPNDTRYYYDTNDANIRPVQDDAYRFNYHSGHVIHDYRYDGAALWTDYLGNRAYYGVQGLTPDMKGIDSVEYSYDRISWHALGSSWTRLTGIVYFSLNGARDRYPVTLDSQEAQDAGSESVLPVNYQAMPPIVVPKKNGLRFYGYWTQPNGQGECFYAADGSSAKDAFFTQASTLYAYWKPLSCDISFDTSSEPGDGDYPGVDKPDQTIAGEQIAVGEKVEIEDPKRPGYVFQGWTIPNAEGTEAIDQDLVYQEDDGKWYVDASKLPDYAGDDGRVELTARWTSVISVDVPSSVTFYADVVTQGNESREGLASSAFGQSKVASQSEVDLRIVGLESKQVKGNGSTSFGASDILKKKDGSTVSGTADKLFSLYPATGELEEDDLKDPDRTSAKPADAVDFSLDDILLEKSFAADSFTIPAGDTLSLGYRLNLQETSTELDYDKLSALSEGASASIANISYCFATKGHHPSAMGSASDDFYIEYDGKVYGPDDIKASADCIASFGEASPCYGLYHLFLESGMDPSDASDAHGYVKWGDGSTYSVRIIGINHDDKSDGSGKAGLTFQFVDCLDDKHRFDSRTHTNSYGWKGSEIRGEMNNVDGGLWLQAPECLRERIATVDKVTHNAAGSSTADLISTTSDKLFLLSFRELVSDLASGQGDAYTAYKWKWKEGNQYAYYAHVGVTPYGHNQGAAQKAVKEEMSSWSLRTCHASYDVTFLYVGADGYPFSGYNDIGVPRGISPCFAL